MMTSHDNRITEQNENKDTASWIPQLLPPNSSYYLVIKLEPNQRTRTQNYLRALQTDASTLKGNCVPVNLSYLPIFKLAQEFRPRRLSLAEIGLTADSLKLPYYVGLENWKRSDQFLEANLVIGQNLLDLLHQLVAFNEFSCCDGLKIMKLENLPYNPGIEASFISSMKSRAFTLPVRYHQIAVMSGSEVISLRLDNDRLDFGVGLSGMIGISQHRLPALRGQAGANVNRLLDASQAAAFKAQKLTPLGQQNLSNKAGVFADGTEGRGRTNLDSSRHFLIGTPQETHLTLKERTKLLKEQTRKTSDSRGAAITTASEAAPQSGESSSPLRMLLTRLAQELQSTVAEVSNVGAQVIRDCTALGLLDPEEGCPPATELLRRVRLFAQGHPDPSRSALFNLLMFRALPSEAQTRFAELTATSVLMPQSVKDELLRAMGHTHLAGTDLMDATSANDLQFRGAQRETGAPASFTPAATRRSGSQPPPGPGPEARAQPPPARRGVAPDPRRTREQNELLSSVQQLFSRYNSHSDIVETQGATGFSAPRIRAREETLDTDELSNETLLAPLMSYANLRRPTARELMFLFRCARELNIRVATGAFVSPGPDISQRLQENQQLQLQGQQLTGQSLGSTTAELREQVLNAQGGDIVNLLEASGFSEEVFICAGFERLEFDRFVRNLLVNDLDILIGVFYCPELSHALISMEVERAVRKNQVRLWRNPSHPEAPTGDQRAHDEPQPQEVQLGVQRFRDLSTEHRTEAHRGIGVLMQDRHPDDMEPEFVRMCKHLETGLDNTYAVMQNDLDSDAGSDWKTLQLAKDKKAFGTGNIASGGSQTQSLLAAPTATLPPVSTSATAPPPPATTTTATSSTPLTATLSGGPARPAPGNNVPASGVSGNVPNINTPSDVPLLPPLAPRGPAPGTNESRTDALNENIADQENELDDTSTSSNEHDNTTINTLVLSTRREGEPVNVLFVDQRNNASLNLSLDGRASTAIPRSTRDMVIAARTVPPPQVSPILSAQTVRTPLRRSETARAADASAQATNVLVPASPRTGAGTPDGRGPAAQGPTPSIGVTSFARDLLRQIPGFAGVSRAFGAPPAVFDVSINATNNQLAALSLTQETSNVGIPSLLDISSDQDLERQVASISRDTLSSMSGYAYGIDTGSGSEVMLRHPRTGVERPNRSGGHSLADSVVSNAGKNPNDPTLTTSQLKSDVSNVSTQRQ